MLRILISLLKPRPHFHAGYCVGEFRRGPQLRSVPRAHAWALICDASRTSSKLPHRTNRSRLLWRTARPAGIWFCVPGITRSDLRLVTYAEPGNTVFCVELFWQSQYLPYVCLRFGLRFPYTNPSESTRDITMNSRCPHSPEIAASHCRR